MPIAEIDRWATSQRAASGCRPGKCSFATAALPARRCPGSAAASGQRVEKPVRISRIARSGMRPSRDSARCRSSVRHLVVGVLRRGIADVDHDRRPDQPFQRDLIDRLAALREVDRRVDVGAAVLGGGEVVRRVVVAGRRHAVGDLVQLERRRRSARRSPWHRRRATDPPGPRRERPAAARRTVPVKRRSRQPRRRATGRNRIGTWDLLPQRMVARGMIGPCHKRTRPRVLGS